MKIIIKGELPSLNEYIHQINRNRYLGNRMKQETQEAIQWAVRSQIARGCKITKPVAIHFLWASRTAKKDIDNVAFAKKFILDSFVNMGLIPNDTRKWVRGFSDEFTVDRKNPHIEVEILPI